MYNTAVKGLRLSPTRLPQLALDVKINGRTWAGAGNQRGLVEKESLAARMEYRLEC